MEIGEEVEELEVVAIPQQDDIEQPERRVEIPEREHELVPA